MASLDFHKLKHAVERQFDKLARHDMFRTEVDKDQLWENYLASFPPGTNPMFRERTEHDCSCCRQFIKQIGNTVAIIDGEVVSVWDIQVDEPAYQAVVDSMSRLVKSQKIVNIFLYPEKNAGTDKNYEQGETRVMTWEHFHVNIPWGRNQGKNYYRPKANIPTELSDARATHDVFLRGLTELTQDSIDTVLDLISQNSLYRGNEYRENLKAFDKLKRKVDKLNFRRVDEADYSTLHCLCGASFKWQGVDDGLEVWKAEHTPHLTAAQDLFVWENLDKVGGSVSRIRNTAIGTLLIDLSRIEKGEEKELDFVGAVKKFETSIMAPSNYKRPTALVTQKMIDAAKKTVEELGLTDALERRYAHLPDIKAPDIIFADHSAKKVIKGVFDDLPLKSVIPKNLDKVETVSIEKFIKDIVPQVDSIEVFFDNKYVNNLVSLIAPAHKDSKPLFKWNNEFSWSYNGDFADSIKERVKKAGGNVTSDLCCRLAWYNYDDKDLHMKEAGGFEIYYGQKRSPFTNGQLDVDMNVSPTTREPVENIFYGNRHKMTEGTYELFVNQFNYRESIDVGFEVEIDYLGDIRRFAYEKPLRQKENVTVAKFKYTHAKGIEIIESLSESSSSKTVWGLKTQDFHKVNVLMLSPNYWHGTIEAEGIGNKHYFFMLADCVNDGQARGFFNEFLRSDLDKHRKVIEMVGAKMKTGESKDQLSGLGFSDTKRAEILVRVKGTFIRMLRVQV